MRLVAAPPRDDGSSIDRSRPTRPGRWIRRVCLETPVIPHWGTGHQQMFFSMHGARHAAAAPLLAASVRPAGAVLPVRGSAAPFHFRLWASVAVFAWRWPERSSGLGRPNQLRRGTSAWAKALCQRVHKGQRPLSPLAHAPPPPSLYLQAPTTGPWLAWSGPPDPPVPHSHWTQATTAPQTRTRPPPPRRRRQQRPPRPARA